jgi:hypothetical protein
MLPLSKLPRYLVKQHDNFTCELAKVSFGYWKKTTSKTIINFDSVELQYVDRYIFIKLTYKLECKSDCKFNCRLDYKKNLILNTYFYINTYRSDIKSIRIELNRKNNIFTVNDKIYLNKFKYNPYESVSYHLNEKRFKYNQSDYYNNIEKIYNNRARILLISIKKHNHQYFWLKYRKGKLCLIVMHSEGTYKYYKA